MSLGLSMLVTSISRCGCSGGASSPSRAARNRSSAASLNCSAGSSLSQMMYLLSASSPTTLSSRMVFSSQAPCRSATDPSRAHSSPATAHRLADTLSGCVLIAGGLKAFDYPVDALGESADIVGFDRGEHRDPQLVAAEFAVRLGVDNAVSPQNRGDPRPADVVDEDDPAHH